ncbi:MAG: hypothetical protein WC028_30420 [Candidatus Obscuribacterales bacterium]
MPTETTNEKRCMLYPTERTSWAKLEPLLVEALTQLHDSESTLFQIAANERTIVGHLACYLRNGKQQLEHDWHIDTDYNRVLGSGGSKRQPVKYLTLAVEILETQRILSSPFGRYLNGFDPGDFNKATVELKKKSRTQKLTTPDLVIHERTCHKIEHNLLAIEFKPTNAQNHLAIIDLARMLVFCQSKEIQDNKEMPTYQHTLFLYPDDRQGFLGWLYSNRELSIDVHTEPKPFHVKVSKQKE